MSHICIIFAISLIAINGGLANPNISNTVEEPDMLWFQSMNVDFIGNWPFGSAYAIACDSARHIAFCGSGGGVFILDATDPSNPQIISDRVRTMGIVNGMFYDASLERLYIACGVAGLEIWDIQNTYDPFKLGDCPTLNAGNVFVADSLALIADDSWGLRIIDVSDPTDPQEIGHYNTPGRAFGVCAEDSFAYVADWIYDLRVIDISDPSNPQEISYCPLPGMCQSVLVSNSYAYVTCGSAGLRIVDISDPYAPWVTGYYDTPGLASELYLSDTIAYLADGEADLRIINVSDPSSPQQISYYDTPASVYGVHVMGACAYLANANGGLKIVDVSDPANPQGIGQYDTPENAEGIVVSGNYAYLADGEAGLQIIDVSDVFQPQHIGYYNTPGYANDIFIAGSDVYIADANSMRIYDVSDPGNPQELGFLGAPGSYFTGKIFVSGIYAYISDFLIFNDVMRIINVSNPASPYQVGVFYPSSGEIGGVHVVDSFGYITDPDANDHCLRIVDISDPSNPQEISYCTLSGNPYEVYVDDTLAYVVAEFYGLYTINVADPVNPVLVSHFPLNPSNDWTDVFAAGIYVYIVDNSGHFIRVIDVSDPFNPQEVGYHGTATAPTGISSVDQYIFASTSTTGLQIYENVLYCISESPNYPLTSYKIHLLQNPIQNNRIKLYLQLQEESTVDFHLYNVSGQVVKTYTPMYFSKGSHTVHLSINDVPSGVYFINTQTKFGLNNIKVVITK